MRNIFDLSQGELFSKFNSRLKGHNDAEVSRMLEIYGKNQIKSNDEKGLILLFLSKLANPLVIMLVIVAIFSIFFGEKISAIIIIIIALMSVILSFVQEHSASQNAKKLQEMVKISVVVIRNGGKKEVPLSQIVPGDIVELSAGRMIPADLKIIVSNNLYINQSSLNGEAFPAKKDPTANKEAASVFDREDLAFMGSSVASGTGRGLVIATGKSTEFGKLSHEITQVKIETAFDKGIKSFTWLMIRLIVVLTIVIFLVNALFKGNFVESLLFSLAVAVGLTPEMLPMIVTVNLSKGAIDMAKKKVIIKQLDSIQNFGAMDVLCTDKTGTLTLNDISLVEYSDFTGEKSEAVLKYAYYVSFFQTGLESVLESAVKNYKTFPTENIKKINEIPFDFERRLMTVIINDGSPKLIAKGAPEEIFQHINSYDNAGKTEPINDHIIETIKKQYDDLSRDGFRVLAVAYKVVDQKDSYNHTDENDMVFSGFISFLDPPKPDASTSIKQLSELGVSLKILSGDNLLVTEKICKEVGLEVTGILTGMEVDGLNDTELKLRVEKTDVFARLNPLQKERIVKALQNGGHIVGFLGDGINDSPAIRQADVGISVNNATDIAKETANIILLEKDLTILAECVKEGRKTFANTIKYIKMGASSNFGNMLSMTGASIFLPFLPMLPMQILLNNFLYDLSQLAIPTDSVDPEYIQKPRPWHTDFIREFIFYIGPISSIFDFLTFGILWYVFHADPVLFHTGWFIESIITQVLVVHIIRTNKIPFFESRPSKTLLLTTLGVVAASIILTFTALGKLVGLEPLPTEFFLILFAMAALYLILVQFVKNWFTRKFGFE